MVRTKASADLQGVYGAVLGGLTASFVGAVLYTVLGAGSGTAGPSTAMIAVLIGLSCAVVFMVCGLFATVRVPWLGSTFLFASGFTALWSAALSFSVEQRWVVLAALAVAIAIGVTMGWLRFSREPAAGPAEATL
jgi:hypothetical protein